MSLASKMQQECKQSILTRLPPELRKHVRSFKDQYEGTFLRVHTIQQGADNDEGITLMPTCDGNVVVVVWERYKNDEWDFSDPDSQMIITTKKQYLIQMNVNTIMAFLQLRIRTSLYGKRQATVQLIPASVWDIEADLFKEGTAYDYDLTVVYNDANGNNVNHVDLLQYHVQLFVSGIRIGPQVELN